MLIKAIGVSISIAAAVGSMAVSGLVLLTVISVFWRYILNRPIFGIGDLSTMALVVIVGAAIPYGASRNAHVSVDIIPSIFGDRVTKWTDVFQALISAVFVSVSAYALLTEGGCGFACGNYTDNLSISHVPFYYVLATGFSVYALTLVSEFPARVKRALSKSL